jgi:hypothetical protein
MTTSENVPADMEVRVGQPAEEIVAAARESKCDSIMLSTRGLTGLDRYLIGSVADRALTWFTGGLNYQTEHHLFPRLPHTAYPFVAPIVADNTVYLLTDDARLTALR